MSRNDIAHLLNQLDSFSVGFGPLFRDFHYSSYSSFPPHNIVKISEDEFCLELAVAGFKKAELTMEEHHGVITIKGSKAQSQEQNPDTYQYKGIANRSFTKTFRIAEYFEVASASLEDGILNIVFVKNVPEEGKPKLISIK